MVKYVKKNLSCIVTDDIFFISILLFSSIYVNIRFVNTDCGLWNIFTADKNTVNWYVKLKLHVFICWGSVMWNISTYSVTIICLLLIFVLVTFYLALSPLYIWHEFPVLTFRPDRLPESWFQTRPFFKRWVLFIACMKCWQTVRILMRRLLWAGSSGSALFANPALYGGLKGWKG